MSKLLASVTDRNEAIWALEADVDIIDLKNPAHGALGALPLETIRDIVAAIHSRKAENHASGITSSSATSTNTTTFNTTRFGTTTLNPTTLNTTISATVGDLVMQPELLVNAIVETAATGVDIVKVGFFPSSSNFKCIAAIASAIHSKGIRVVAVILADLEFDPRLLAAFAAAGFYGVMFDTFNKDGSNLYDHISIDSLSHYISQIHMLDMESGLAGSLRIEHLEQSIMINPGYIGFRGALCREFDRVARVDRSKMIAMREMLHKYNEKRENLYV